MDNFRCGKGANRKWALLMLALYFLGCVPLFLWKINPGRSLYSIRSWPIMGALLVILFLWQRSNPYLEISGDELLISNEKHFRRAKIKLWKITKAVEEPGFDIVLTLADNSTIVVKTENLKADELSAFLRTLRGIIGQTRSQ